MFLNKSFSYIVDSKFVSPQVNRCLSPSFSGEFFFRRCLEAFAAGLLLLSTQTALAIAVGEAVPGCAFSPFGESQNSELSQYKGKVLYVDFWASWCGPCAKSFPFMNELSRDLKNKGLQVIGVNLDENLEDAKGFLAKYPVGFTVVTDPGEQCAKRFDVKAMPSSYLIDRKGIVRHVHLGFRSGESEDLRLLIEQLLAENPVGR